MNDVTKIPFSLAEMQLIKSADVFLTKKKAFDQVKCYLLKLQEDIESTLQKDVSLNFVKEEFTHRKISVGESYKLMPYQVSDFPAKFSKDDIFTIRCLVWWGNEVSVHLLLQGLYLKKYSNNIGHNFRQLPQGFYGCNANTPWEHHFERSNYIPIDSYSFDKEKVFCKVGKKYNLSILTKGREEIVSDILLLLRLLINN